MRWYPSQGDFKLGKKAKQAAKESTTQGSLFQRKFNLAMTTVQNNAMKTQQRTRTLPPGVGKYSKRMDSALPGKHTRDLYDQLNKEEASTLAQLRTGMTRLNDYLYRIGAVESEKCDCGHAKETVEHFLFRCTKWAAFRTEMLLQTDTRRGNLSFFLGGKTATDPPGWKPNMNAVQATIRYAMKTGRLRMEEIPASQQADDLTPLTPN